MTLRLLAPLLFLLTALLAPGAGALAVPPHQGTESVLAAEDCPRHAGPERRQQNQQQGEHRSCCDVGCWMSAVLGLPPAPALPVLAGRHEAPPPAAPPPAHQTEAVFHPPR